MTRALLARFLAAPAAPLSLVVALGLLAATPAEAASTSVLALHFDSGESLAGGTPVVDTSGQGNDGTVRTGFGGSIASAIGYAGTRSARYPAVCEAGTCPKAILQVPDSPSLDLGLAAFSWGTRLRLDARQTSKGENLVQKGLYGDATGQWKLQVDGNPGLPSCVVSGSRADGTSQRVVVVSSVTVADGTWHQVLCRRTSSGVVILVDGIQRGHHAMRPVDLAGTAPVAIGGKQVENQDNDQFFGLLDDVVVRRG